MTETEAIKFLEDFYDDLNLCYPNLFTKEAFIADMIEENKAWGNGWQWFIKRKFCALQGQVRPIREENKNG